MQTICTSFLIGTTQKTDFNMKHLIKLLTMAITLTGLGQQMPYNPDANGDDFVGVDDVLGVLGVYDTALMQPDLQCDYEGTDLEQLFGDWISGAIVMDSIYLEYLLVDSVIAYNPNCPEPVIEEVVLERSYLLNLEPFLAGSWVYVGGWSDYLGFYRDLYLGFNQSNGFFELYWQDTEVSTITAGTYNAVANPWDGQFTLPFASDWDLDEDGVQISWEPDSWPANCQQLRIIPFWHEAE